MLARKGVVEDNEGQRVMVKTTFAFFTGGHYRAYRFLQFLSNLNRPVIENVTAYLSSTGGRAVEKIR